jgi:hypothetical protein
MPLHAALCTLHTNLPFPNLLSAASPPFFPAAHVMYPPMMDPAKAHEAYSIGEEIDEERNAVSSSNTRSVLPGKGIGTTEESITARAKIPTPPSLISHWKKSDDDFPFTPVELDSASTHIDVNAAPFSANGK